MTFFEFPDVADYPENKEPRCDETRVVAPAFYHRTRFQVDLNRLYESVLATLEEVDRARPILKAHRARVAAAANAYFTLPSVHGSALTGAGVMHRRGNTSHLRKFFAQDIAAVSEIDTKGRSVKEIDRVRVRDDAAACGLVQGFLDSMGMIREACRYRSTVAVKHVAIQVSRPGDRHHYQQFADCGATPRLLNLHMDPKPGVIKAIIYLGDVGPENGPFQCVPGSNRWDVDEIERIFAWGNSVANYCHTPLHRRVANAFPKRFRKNAIVGRLIPDDSDMGQFLWPRLKSYTSDVANVMLFDPCFILHRGGQCKSGERVNLQVVLK